MQTAPLPHQTVEIPRKTAVSQRKIRGYENRIARKSVDVKRDVAAAGIIRGAQNYAAYVEREHTNPKYVPQAQTWLHQERWTQYQEAAGDDAPTPIML